MKYQIQILPTALRELAGLPKKDQKRVDARIQDLVRDPLPPGVQILRGYKGLFRLRVGDYRVLYSILKEKLIILIVRVGHRKDAYRRL